MRKHGYVMDGTCVVDSYNTRCVIAHHNWGKSLRPGRECEIKLVRGLQRRPLITQKIEGLVEDLENLHFVSVRHNRCTLGHRRPARSRHRPNEVEKQTGLAGRKTEVLKVMKKAILVAFFALASAGLAMGQNATSTVDVLGAHNNAGRGCAGCHAPHSGSFGSGHGGGADAGSYALWGQDASPLYGKTIAFGDNGKYTEVLPTTITGGFAGSRRHSSLPQLPRWQPDSPEHDGQPVV